MNGMAKPRLNPIEGSLAEAIAAECGCDMTSVETFLLKHNLAQPSLLPMPVDITVKAVSFSGERPVAGEQKPFKV